MRVVVNAAADSVQKIPQTPVFKALVHAEIVSPHQVIVFDEYRERHLLEGSSYSLLAPYLSQGEFSTDQIIAFLEGKISESEIYYALLCLQEKGFIAERSKKLSQAIQVLCNLLNVSMSDAEKRLNGCSISIKTFGNICIKPLQTALESLSLQVVEKGDFSIFVIDNYRKQELREAYLQSKTPCLLIRPTGSEIWIGPLLVPGKTACLDCLVEVLTRNSIEERFVELKTNMQAPITIRTSIIPTSLALAYNHAANEVFKWILQGTNLAVEGKIISCGFLDPSMTSHHVVKRPQCPHCGILFSQTPQPLVLKSQKKQFSEAGGNRIKPPEETYQTYEHLISPITGIVESLRLRTGPFGFPTCVARHNFGDLPLNTPWPLRSLRTSSTGVGKIEAQGKTSCLCEAIERFSGVFQGNESRKKNRYDQIKEDAIHPHSLLLFSENQYKTRQSLNKPTFSSHFIPLPFDDHREIEWTSVWSLTEKRFKQIPSGICYFAYPFPSPEEIFFIGDGNGCAAGNTKEEAILQGFFELVERDSISLWWNSRLQCPEVDLSSFQDPYIDQLISFYASLNRKLWVIDITMNLNIPTFVALSSIIGDAQEKITLGFGSHFDPKISLLRALTEMNQFCLLFEPHVISNLKSPKGVAVKNWIETVTLLNNPYLSPNPYLKIKRYQDYTRFDTTDIKEDILICQKIVEEKGLEMLVLEQTRPEIGLPVVKVFVPGLRHYWNRYAPGRLYDVPLELGLVKHKLKEEELNPLVMFP